MEKVQVKGYRFYYDKSIEYLYAEELKNNDSYRAFRYAKARQRMYANLFNRDMRKVLIDDESKCSECESKHKLTVDHIVPVSKGGTNTVENVRIVCLSCNLKKGAQYAR